MYCIKCNSVHGNNSHRYSCRDHSLQNGKCIYCGPNYKGNNCRHIWKPNIDYYIEGFKNIIKIKK